MFGVTLPKSLRLAAAVALIGWLTWRTPAQGPLPAPRLAAALLVFCLFYSQAFFNYFYLVQYLMLLGLADWFARDGEGGS
jgi:hypothetical protein